MRQYTSFDNSGREDGTTAQLSFSKLLVADFLLLNCAFYTCNFLKRGKFDLTSSYENLLLIFYACWFLTALVAKKFRPSSYSTYGDGIFVLFKSCFYLTYAVTFIVVVFGLVSYSRIQVFSTCAALLALNCTAWSFYCKYKGFKGTGSISLSGLFEPYRIKNKISYPLFFLDAFLVVCSFFIVNYLKRDHLGLLPDYSKLFIIFIGLWFVFSVITNKFSTTGVRSIYFFIWQWVKAGVLMLASASVIIYGFRLFEYSRAQSLGTITLLLVFELIAVSVYYKTVICKDSPEDIESVEEVKNILKQEELSLDVDIDLIRQKMNEPCRQSIRQRLSEKRKEVFEFVDSNIELNDILRMETSVEHSSKTSDLNGDRLPLRIFINLWKVNDIRRINEYFLKVHKLLLPGGYYICHAHTISTHYDWIYSKFPRIFAHVIYTFDFLINRVCPKLPGLKKIYFSITKGKNRIISRAEILGRLCFCGFEIIAEKEIGKRLYVISRKVKTPSLDESPTYGPLVELKRVGYGNRIVSIYKIRTMHPYSEYLQKYVFEQKGLQKGGKLSGDFRTTSWGKVMRRLWLDELPMLYNWIKGDLQLVGVRPLSPHFFSLYDEELQNLRRQIKPGLIPPFYADLPETFEEICESEKRYIKSFLKSPVRTQFIYFFKAFVNIVFKGARSN